MSNKTILPYYSISRASELLSLAVEDLIESIERHDIDALIELNNNYNVRLRFDSDNIKIKEGCVDFTYKDDYGCCLSNININRMNDNKSPFWFNVYCDIKGIWKLNNINKEDIQIGEYISKPSTLIIPYDSGRDNFDIILGDGLTGKDTHSSLKIHFDNILMAREDIQRINEASHSEETTVNQFSKDNKLTSKKKRRVPTTKQANLIYALSKHIDKERINEINNDCDSSEKIITNMILEIPELGQHVLNQPYSALKTISYFFDQRGTPYGEYTKESVAGWIKRSN